MQIISGTIWSLVVLDSSPAASSSPASLNSLISACIRLVACLTDPTTKGSSCTANRALSALSGFHLHEEACAATGVLFGQNRQVGQHGPSHVQLR
jgi:hypothetical protein